MTPARKKILMALLPLALVLLVAELVARALPEPAVFAEAGYRETYSFSTLFVPHPFFSFAPNPDHPAFYGHGLREDREITLEPARNRVICLGGSATYGSRVERQHAWPAQLESLLQSRGMDVEVLNAGVHAYATPNIIGWLSLRIIDLHPRMVIFYVGYNDVLNWVHFPGFRSDYSHSQKSWEMPEVDRPFWAASALLRRATHWQPPLVHIHSVTFKPFSEDYENNFRSADPTVLTRNLITLAAICRAHGAEPVFVLEATDFLGHPEGGEELMRVYGEAIAAADRAMAEAATRAGVRRVDSSTMNNQRNLFADFIHLNEPGNRRLAEIIAEAIPAK